MARPAADPSPSSVRPERRRCGIFTSGPLLLSEQKRSASFQAGNAGIHPSIHLSLSLSSDFWLPLAWELPRGTTDDDDDAVLLF